MLSRLVVVVTALLALAACVSGASVEVFTDNNPSGCQPAFSNTDGPVYGIPDGGCRAALGGSVSLTCTRSGPSFLIDYKQWKDDPTNSCAGTADITATGPEADCLQIYLAGAPAGTMRVNCNSATTRAISIILLAALAFVATRAQML